MESLTKKEVNKKQDKRLETIEKHVVIMNTEMGQLRDKMGTFNTEMIGVKLQVTRIATNMDWLMKIMCSILMAVVLGVVGALLKLVLK